MSELIKLVECMTTWQGEGPNSGSRMLLVRFKRCDRVEMGKPCSWCDTLVKMRVSMETSCTLDDIQTILTAENAGLMITGGEPTYDTNIQSTLTMLNELDYPIANIESNGYKLLELIEKCDMDKPINFMYSPKFFSMTELEKVKVQAKEIMAAKDTYLKVVCEDNVLVDDFLSYVTTFVPGHRIFLMPEGKDRESIVKNSAFVFDVAEIYKTNFSSRDHLIYGFV